MTTMEECAIADTVRAIVMFGPATDVSGFRPAEFFQVTIDPNMVSPGGKFIRFGQYKGDEIVGWQRVQAMTVCELLGENKDAPMSAEGYEQKDDATVLMRFWK